MDYSPSFLHKQWQKFEGLFLRMSWDHTREVRLGMDSCDSMKRIRAGSSAQPSRIPGRTVNVVCLRHGSWFECHSQTPHVSQDVIRATEQFLQQMAHLLRFFVKIFSINPKTCFYIIIITLAQIYCVNSSATPL